MASSQAIDSTVAVELMNGNDALSKMLQLPLARWTILPILTFFFSCILVPQHLVPFLSCVCYFTYRSLGPSLAWSCLFAYVTWMCATNHLKRSAADVAPEWVARILQWALRGYLDFAGCSFSIIMEYVPPKDSPEKFVVCYSPHGAFSTCGICYAMPQFRLHPLLRHLKGTIMAASALFYVPFLRETLLVLGCREVIPP